MSNNPSTIARGNMINQWVVATTLTPASFSTSISEQTFTVKGLHLGDFVAVNKPSSQTNIGIEGSRVSAADTLAITYSNFSGATVTPTAAEVYTVAVLRPENLNSAGTASGISSCN
jgi:hypothetical protein